MKTATLIAFAVTALSTVALADGNLLPDPGFEALNGPTVRREAIAGEWSIPPGLPYAKDIEVKAAATAAHSGKTGLTMRALNYGSRPAIHQQLPQLAAGIYEFKVWAKGTVTYHQGQYGILVMKADALHRRCDLTPDWAEFSLTFEQAKTGPVDLMLLIDGIAQVDDATLSPALAERQAAWQRQEQARAEYGFVPEYFSAQAPLPGAPARLAGKFQAGPVTWRDKAVFYDKSYDTPWATHPEALARYLGANGFQVLAAAPFGAWMQKAVHEGAYGTVCVMPMGLYPASVCPRYTAEDDPRLKDSLIRKYLDAGGRVVWTGEMPFSYTEDDVHPQLLAGAGPSVLLGLRSDYMMGRPSGPAKIQGIGQAWGLVEATPLAPVYPEDVTAILTSAYSDTLADEVALCWFKNFNPLCPWSGFIYPYRGDDMAKPALQETVYRLALYAGQPVTAPAGIAAPPVVATPAPLQVILDPPRDRHNYYRGEKIPVRLELGAVPECAVGRDRVPAVRRGSHCGGADAEDGVPPNDHTGGRWRLSLVRNGESLAVTECPPPTKQMPSVLDLPTADLACGDYQLTVQAVNDGKEAVVHETTVSLCPRREDPTFFFAPGIVDVANPYRQELAMKEIAAAGMQMGIATANEAPGMLDRALKHGLRFSLRALPDTLQLSPAETEAAAMRGPNGERLGSPYGGSAGLLHPKRRQQDAAAIAKQVKELSAWPNSWRRCETADDFAVLYGWDYSELAKRLFKEKTGLEAPVPPELGKLKERFRGCGAIGGPKGIVPDNDPWLQWSIFTTRDIVGGYNHALAAACEQAVPGLKLGPIPGGMAMPLWSWGQYPPHSFGAAGFNLLNYYYYAQYWQPLIGNLYWDEIARINNRDLELWTLPDCVSYDEPTYFRNTFFLHLAGGCQGINYFNYPAVTPAAWKELSRLGSAIIHPLYPFLGKLRPVQTESGLLLPYTTYAHSPAYPTIALYAYANLLGAHLDVQPTCEEEALSGYIKKYKTILLWHAQWMRASAVKALEEYIAKGGIVLADATSTVAINGALKLPVDLAMGPTPSKPDFNDPRLGFPGVKDYLHPDRVAAIGQALGPYLQPWADCADPTLIVRRHTYRGVTYLWLVNVHTRDEYEYVSEHLGSVGNRWPDPEKARQEAYRYLAERAQGKRFTPRVTIPAGNWAAYDVLKGQRVPLAKDGQRLAFSADMERLGGTLIALYPEPVARVRATIARKGFSWFGLGGARIARGQEATLRVRVTGPSGQPLAGTQPLAVTVTTPQGEWPEITGAHATNDGVWTATIHPAVNDPAGTWRIAVKELSSGITGETSFAVR